MTENPKHLWRGQHGDAPGAAVVPAIAMALAVSMAEAVQFGEGVVGRVVAAGVVGLPVVVVLLARPSAIHIRTMIA